MTGQGRRQPFEAVVIQFEDKLVSYDTFLNDLSARIVRLMKEDADEREYISQREAYRMFGRGNVDRWRRNNMITPHKRPGKVEYLTAELRMLQRTGQDYFTE